MEYTILKKVQELQLGILKEFDRICTKHGINYTLFKGTMLGAVRHNGFIPWDDDIDVALLRTDYEKLLSIIRNEISDSYIIDSSSFDKNTYYSFTKIRCRNTVLAEKGFERKLHKQGIFIDVFPLDNLSDQKKERGIQLRRIRFYTILKRSKLPLMMNRNLFKIISKLPLKIFSILPYSFFNRKITQIATKFNNIECREVALLTNGIPKSGFDKFIFPSIFMSKFTKVSFEEFEFQISCFYHEMLTRLYSNYLELPDLEERIPHHGVLVSFDMKEFYDGYIHNKKK